jgi:hypothetical protein
MFFIVGENHVFYSHYGQFIAYLQYSSKIKLTFQHSNEWILKFGN